MKLDERMKGYEKVARNYLMKKQPVILWIDGKSFHTFTRGFEKPFDNILINTMRETMIELVDNIQGAKFGYTQSDEISILLTDYFKFDTDAWFNYRVAKLCSIGASMATMIFNSIWREKNSDLGNKWRQDRDAMFDCRCFNVPDHEVGNFFLWRQQNWLRNSVQMVARNVFSQKELYKKNQEKMKEMLLDEGIIWDDLSPVYKYGSSFDESHIHFRKMRYSDFDKFLKKFEGEE